MSQLLNATHKIAWPEFTTHKKDPAPAAGTVGAAAYTSTTITTQGFGLAGIPGSRPPKAQVKDTIVVSVSLDPSSWVEDWIFALPKAKQDDLLNHEQGHFSTGALLARDFYYDLLQLRKKQYTSPSANNDFESLKKSRDAALVGIIKKYDEDTKHGTVAAQQARWDGFFSSAATQNRTPSETAQDGTTLKIRLVDLLKSFGIVV